MALMGSNLTRRFRTLVVAVGPAILGGLALPGAAEAAGAPMASGGGFELVRGTHSGGGGSSSGGDFSAQTTTSQPDAGQAEGGDYDVTGSFGEGDPADCAALATSAALSASETFCAGVRVVWDDASDFESGYRLYRDGVELTTTAPGVTSYDDSSAAPGVVHAYHVVLFNDCGVSEPSNSDPGHRPLPPVAPGGLQVTGHQPFGDSVRVDLAWNDLSPDEFAQIVYRLGPGALAAGVFAPGTESGSVTVAHDGAFPYCFAVAAANCGLEAMSDTVCLVTSSVDEAGAPQRPPDRPGLGPVAPNPFNPRVRIAYQVVRAAQTSLVVFDVNGRHVRTLHHALTGPGRYVAEWTGLDERGRGVASGIYFVEMRTAGFRAVERVVLLK